MMKVLCLLAVIAFTTAQHSEVNRSCDACDGPWHVPFERVALALAENKFDFAGKRRTKIANANFAAVSKVELSRQIEENLRLKETEMDDDLRAYWQNYKKAAKAELSRFHDAFAANLSESAKQIFASIRTLIANESLSLQEECQRIKAIFQENLEECLEIQSQPTYRDRVAVLPRFGPISPSYTLATVTDEARDKFLNIWLNATQFSVPVDEIRSQQLKWLATQNEDVTATIGALQFGGKVLGHLQLSLDKPRLSPDNYDKLKKMTEIYLDEGGETSASAACKKIGDVVARLDRANAKSADFTRLFSRATKKCDENFLAFRFLDGYGRFAVEDKSFRELLALNV